MNDAVLFEESRLGPVLERAFMLSHPRGRRAAPAVISQALAEHRQWMKDNGAHGMFVAAIQAVRLKLRLTKTGEDGWLHVAPWSGHTQAQLEDLRQAMHGRPVTACRSGYPGARGGPWDCRGYTVGDALVCQPCAGGVQDAVPKKIIDVERKKRGASAGLRKHGRGRW